jgi:hypothetical protein
MSAENNDNPQLVAGVIGAASLTAGLAGAAYVGPPAIAAARTAWAAASLPVLVQNAEEAAAAANAAGRSLAEMTKTFNEALNALDDIIPGTEESAEATQELAELEQQLAAQAKIAQELNQQAQAAAAAAARAQAAANASSCTGD